jgi:hypothetical protein
MNQEGIIETLKRALTFYAAEATYQGDSPIIKQDSGTMAKTTLEIVAKAEQANTASDDDINEIEKYL